MCVIAVSAGYEKPDGMSLVHRSAIGGQPLQVIFDTDIDSDNDDAAAVAMLHAMADAGKVEILAMGVVSRCPHSPACLDAINTYYGRGDIPIGIYKGKELTTHSRYARVVAEQCPNNTGLADHVSDVVQVYRRVLARQSDRSVTMIAVGYMHNLVNLLRSPPDEFSRLAGRELVQQGYPMTNVTRIPSGTEQGNARTAAGPLPPAFDEVRFLAGTVNLSYPRTNHS